MDNGAENYRRFLKGDESGFAEIVDEYKDGLILYINSIVSNLHIAEDLTEDTFVKLVVNKPHFYGKSKFKTWLYSIARNTAADYKRKTPKRGIITASEYASLYIDRDTVEKEYLKKEQKIRLHRMLETLTEDYRQVIYLIYFENLNITEAARVMKKSKRQISNLLYRAKQTLKEKLEKEGFVYEEF